MCPNLRKKSAAAMEVSVPLRGVGCVFVGNRPVRHQCVSVPLRGVGCVEGLVSYLRMSKQFPSPYGAWVVSTVTVTKS